jgi:hypothetical protein
MSPNPYAIMLDESQERVEQEREEKEVVYPFQSTRHRKRQGIRKSDAVDDC